MDLHIHPELEEFDDFIEECVKFKSTIHCFCEGIDIQQFAIICELPGASDDVQQALIPLLATLPTAGHDGIANILNILIAKQTSFYTLEQYSWLARTSVAAQLLTGLPKEVEAIANRLRGCFEYINIAGYNHSPEVVNAMTKTLKEDIPLKDVNLLKTIRSMALSNFSPVLFYTALALIFSGLDEVTGRLRPNVRHQVYDMSECLKLLDLFIMKRLRQTVQNLQNVYQLLKLLGLYQHMVILPNYGKSEEELISEHKCYAEFFYVTKAQMKAFRESVSIIGTHLNTNLKGREEDHLILTDVIQTEILPWLEGVELVLSGID